MKTLMCSLLILILGIHLGFAQQEETSPPPQAPPQGERTVIDLTQMGKTYQFSARMELPQVRIFEKRITPEFKDVTAEKSFLNELSTRSEQIEFEPITSGRVKPISDINTLLKKKRF
ncbi:MAG: hypothetical protein Kow0042_09810 [Calditrichia bacterium]